MPDPTIDPRRHRPGCDLPPPVRTVTATGRFVVLTCAGCGAVAVSEVGAP